MNVAEVERRRHRAVRTLILCTLAALVLGIGFIRLWGKSTWNRETIEASYVTGDRIANALHHYYTKHGSYPGRLDVLVPTFIGQIDPPSAGLPTWRYTVSHDMKHYELSFCDNSDCYPRGYTTDIMRPEWRLDQ